LLIVIGPTLEQICAELFAGHITLEDFEGFLTLLEQATGESIDQDALIQCLQNAGIVFPTDTDSVRTLR
jgi:hypothetical protein